MKLELLSPNLILLIEECLKNENLSKFLKYGDANPISKPAFNPSGLVMTKIFPYPFNLAPDDQKRCQLHIYYPSIKFNNNEIVEDTAVAFDIVVHKDLWLINDGVKKIRPYEMAREIINHFSNMSIKTLGEMDFVSLNLLVVNEEYDALQIIARATTFNG